MDITEKTDMSLGYTVESTDRLLADVDAMEDLDDHTKDLTAGKIVLLLNVCKQ